MRSRLRSEPWAGRVSALALACVLGLVGFGPAPAQVTDTKAAQDVADPSAIPASEELATLLAESSWPRAMSRFSTSRTGSPRRG